MDFFDKVVIAKKAVEGIIFKKKFPLIAVCHITYRCNLKCVYCGYHERNTDELDTNNLFCLIEKFYRLGTKFIVITGGEPLLRDDLGEIVDFCKKKRMFVSMNSNGMFVKEKIDAIRNIDMLKLSLDGPRPINDRIKGKGVYDKVIGAIEACKREGIKVNITTVISKYNVFFIRHILDIAKEYGVGVFFQPADQTHCGNIEKNIISELPNETDYKKAITLLIKEKHEGNNCINNSVAGLQHLYRWPGPRKIPCLVSLFSFFLSPDGRVFICDMFPCSQNYLTSIGRSLKETLGNLTLPYRCEHCWTGSAIDFNLLAGLKLSRVVAFWNKL